MATEQEMRSTQRFWDMLYGDDGELLFPEDQVKIFLPYFVWNTAESLDPDDLAPEVAQMMESFAQKVGIREDMTDDEVVATVEGFFKENPVGPELMATYRKFMQDETLAESTDDTAGKRFNEFLGESRPTVAHDSPAPEGSVRGGLLAQMQFRS